MKIALRSMANGKLVCAEDGGAQPLIANREGIGTWETFELILLEGSVDPPPPSGPIPEMSAAYVAAVKAQLEREGLSLSGPCGAFRITKRVAWGLRDGGAGLLSKTSGNNCDGYATDIIVYRDGRAFDILGDGGNANVPNWLPTDVDDPAGRWRAPVQP